MREHAEIFAELKDLILSDIDMSRDVNDEEIYEKSIELLRPYNGAILQEKVKIDLVDKLYSKEMLQGTEFYKKFKAEASSQTSKQNALTMNKLYEVLFK